VAKPLSVTIPHKLGAEAARDRLVRGLTSVKRRFGEQVTVADERWTDDTLELTVKALAQTVSARVEVGPETVRIEAALPLMLRMFSAQVEGYLKAEGGKFFNR
jgi:hypothetical protein